ncbi:hypothetical protein GE061_009448 [Apolygus lucorum]|uniref:SET domain-containing protein n=1 Tax=Apolygus lucorum TaxID=248454 RepID=A0A8S9Y4B7_APOLU|nr:hypothetical protein GE061_009448 [Apolygus lucorum]
MTDVLEAKLVRRGRFSEDRKWTIAESELGGRGVFASCDIASGELVFADLPILYGPKQSSDLVACTSCSDISRPLRKCSKNCHLPFCSDECEIDESHKKECCYLSSLNLTEDEWSPYIFRALTLIRSLLMSDDDREVVKHLHANRGRQVDIQVSSLLSLLGNTLSEKDVSWVRHCCGVLDGTAFEIELKDSATSLKGLFPLSAMMNHNCVPNTRHLYADRVDGYRMEVVASQPIPKGTQIFTSYCPLLWATSLRRTFLLHTKHFQCKCERCKDPSEFGTNLQAVKCSCESIMLPKDPLNFNSEWKCEHCGELRSAKHNISIQKSLRNLNALDKSMPEHNYIRIQMKIDHVFKKTKGMHLEDITDEELRTVSEDCMMILKLIVQLKLGNTRFKGRLCERLSKVSDEMNRRCFQMDTREMGDFIECGRTIENEDQRALQNTW